MRLGTPALGIPSGAQSNGPSISGTPTAATIGTAYTWVPSTSGLTAPLTFALTAGTAPSGTVFSTSTGGFPGTPTTAQTRSGISIQVTDSSAIPKVLTLSGLSIVVTAAFVLTNAPTTTASTSASYSYTPATTGGRATYVWAITNKPSWASFSTSTGALTGTTPGSGETDSGIVITGTDADGRTVTTGSFTITVSSVVMAAINALEVMGSSSLDPQLAFDTNTYGIQGNGNLLRVNINATVNGPISNLNASKFTVTVATPGYDSTGAAQTWNLVMTPTAVIRRQADGGSPNDITQTTQLCYQPAYNGGAGTVNNAPTVGVAADFFLQLPDYVYAGDTVTVTVANDWNGSGTGGAGSGPAVTNNSTIADTTVSKPVYGWQNMPLERVTANTGNPVELNVAFHRHGYLGGGAAIGQTFTSGQMVACVEIFATDGTTTTSHTVVSAPTISTIQTINHKPEVFAADINLSTLADTDGSTTLGPGRAYYDAIIKPWRGTAHQISVSGVSWPCRSPQHVLPIVKDVAGKYGNAYAYVNGVAGTGTVSATPLGSIALQTAAAFGSIQAAAAGLATYFANAGSTGRPASSIAHNNPHGGTIVLTNATGSPVTYELGATYTPASTGNCWCDITSSSLNTALASYATVSSTRRFDGGGVRFNNMDVQKNTAGGFSANDSTPNSVATMGAYKNCTRLIGTSTTAFFQNTALLYFQGNVDTIGGAGYNGTTAGFTLSGTTPNSAVQIVGHTYGDNTTATMANVVTYYCVGFKGRHSPTDPSSSQGSNDGMIYCNNELYAFSGNTITLYAGTYAVNWGGAINQNIFEEVASGTGNNVGVSYATSVTVDMINVGWLFNTGACDPSNGSSDLGGFSLGYRSETGALGKVADVIVVGNLTNRFAFKGDYFSQHNASTKSAGNVGNNKQRYGFGPAKSNVQMLARDVDIGGSQFDWRACDNPLLLTSPQDNTAVGVTISNAGIIAFTTNNAANSAWSSGSGFGNYTLPNGASLAKNRVAAGTAWLKYDAAGTLRKNAAGGSSNVLGAAGLYEAAD